MDGRGISFGVAGVGIPFGMFGVLLVVLVIVVVIMLFVGGRLRWQQYRLLLLG